MDYNTQREKLAINDYGRSVSKLIAYARTIDDREQRNRVARAIVGIMAQLTGGKSHPSAEEQRKYWVHLMILADWNLDIDLPYPISPEEGMDFKPKRMHYTDNHIRYRHYGSIMERMIKKVAEYPEGEEREELTSLIAHAMKRNYLLYNTDTVKDVVVREQIKNLSDGKLQVGEDFHFRETQEYLEGSTDMNKLYNTAHPKKKKKKKKKNKKPIF